MAAILIVLIALVAAGLIITYLQKARMNAHRAASQNNMRQLALFAAHHASREPSQDPAQIPRHPIGNGRARRSITGKPPQLVRVRPPPARSARQDVVGLLTRINDQGPWSDPRNQEAARTRLLVALCPLNTQNLPGGPAGHHLLRRHRGRGRDAAALALPPSPERAPKRAGAFRYESSHALRSHW